MFFWCLGSWFDAWHWCRKLTHCSTHFFCPILSAYSKILAIQLKSIGLVSHPWMSYYKALSTFIFQFRRSPLDNLKLRNSFPSLSDFLLSPAQSDTSIFFFLWFSSLYLPYHLCLHALFFKHYIFLCND